MEILGHLIGISMTQASPISTLTDVTGQGIPRAWYPSYFPQSDINTASLGTLGYADKAG